MQEKSKLPMNKNSDSKYEKGILDGTEDIFIVFFLSCICSWADSAIVLIIRYSGKNGIGTLNRYDAILINHHIIIRKSYWKLKEKFFKFMRHMWINFEATGMN